MKSIGHSLSMKQISPLQDTIAAIATPAGVGGVGIVRVSGPLAEEVAHKIFRPRRDVSQFKSHRLYYGHIIDAETQEVIDEVLIALMRAPHSYKIGLKVHLQPSHPHQIRKIKSD